MNNDDNIREKITKLYAIYPNWFDLQKRLGPIFDLLGRKLKSQEIYDILFDKPDTAPCGKVKRFASFGQGYFFCERSCSCAKEMRAKKAQETNLSRYGVRHPSTLPEFKEKARQTNISRYGVEYIGQIPEVQEKCRKTNMKKYGVEYLMQNPEIFKLIQEKSRKSKVERYGVENTSQLDHIKEKVKKTNLERYGVEYLMQDTEMRKKARQTNIVKFGVEHVMQNSDILAKATKTNITRYGVSNSAQRHISQESLSILKNPVLLQKAVEEKSITTLAQDLGIDSTTLCKYWNRHNLPSLVGSSSYENEIKIFLSNLDIRFEKNNKSILHPNHLDFYIPDHNLAIEFNGIYWHSTAVRPDRLYHRMKYEGCRNKRIRLLMINEDEWQERSSVIKSRIMNILGKSERGSGARKLRINALSNSEANSFFDTYHVQGRTGSIIYAVGAWEHDRLVGVMAFNKQRNTHAVELVRYATDGKTYAGLFSRLLSKSIADQGYTSILSFADLRYSEGAVYEKNGFILADEIPVDYRYVYQGRTWHKSSFTKKKISEKFKLDMSVMTERQAMESLGIPRIYDCGKLKYVWENAVKAGTCINIR